jgi:hypothetical protein
MPLTKAGQRTLRRMMLQYGSKKGKEIFYAKENSPGDEKWKKAVLAKKGKGK